MGAVPLWPPAGERPILCAVGRWFAARCAQPSAVGTGRSADSLRQSSPIRARCLLAGQLFYKLPLFVLQCGASEATFERPSSSSTLSLSRKLAEF